MPCGSPSHGLEATEDFAPVAPTVALKSKILDIVAGTSSVGPILSRGVVVVQSSSRVMLPQLFLKYQLTVLAYRCIMQIIWAVIAQVLQSCTHSAIVMAAITHICTTWADLGWCQSQPAGQAGQITRAIFFS